MNKKEYKDLLAFHPGYYINDILEDMNISQKEFAKRMGTTGKTLSELLSGKINLSSDMALNLSRMMGTSVDVWLNIQSKYEKKILEIKQAKKFDEENEVLKLIDYNYFIDLGCFVFTKSVKERIKQFCSYLKISSLKTLKEKDLLANCRTSINTIDAKNIINTNVWIQTAINFSSNIKIEKFDELKLKSSLSTIRQMTKHEPVDFLPKLKEIFSQCGVAFVLLPHLKNSGINGAVKWIDKDKVILAINNRGADADKFWFTLFHEIKHVLQKKIKVLIINTECSTKEFNDNLENEADLFSKDVLIPLKEYKNFIKTNDFSEEAIVSFAKRNDIQEGIVVGRLQKEKILPYHQFNYLKAKIYNI